MEPVAQEDRIGTQWSVRNSRCGRDSDGDCRLLDSSRTGCYRSYYGRCCASSWSSGICGLEGGSTSHEEARGRLWSRTDFG